MATDASLMRKARTRQQQDVRTHREADKARREALQQKVPRLTELDKLIRLRFLESLQNPGTDSVNQAREAIGRLQKERETLLRGLGATVELYEGTPLCPRCKDSGKLADGICSCVMEHYRRLQTKELSSMLNLEHQNFDTFNLDLFSDRYDAERGGSPREQIDLNYEVCVNFSSRFGTRSENLIFSGPPGTGKTFLSSCVAGAVCERGFSVVYDTAIHLLQLMERFHFGRGDEDTEAGIQRIRKCDLLIIDDLGTEFLSSFDHTALMDIINSRLMERKTMLISTNLSRNELQERYKEALSSRLEGEFTWIPFWGDDLRQKEK